MAKPGEWITHRGSPEALEPFEGPTPQERDSLLLLEKQVDTGRASVLLGAAGAVLQDRNADYGPPEDNFRDIAALWGTFTGYTFSSRQVAIMCALIKVARMKTSPGHSDHLIDMAGYAACAGDCTDNPVTPLE